MVDFQYKNSYGVRDLVEIVRILRQPGGCPWDREQDHHSIRRNLLEEAYEDKVQLVGFGAFEVKKRAERIGRNPKTKESIKIPASKVPVFKPGKALKDAVAK